MTANLIIGILALYLLIGFFLNQALEDNGQYSLLAIFFYPAMILFTLLLVFVSIIDDLVRKE